MESGKIQIKQIQHFQECFTDFDNYRESAFKWNIDFRKVSRGNFTGYLNMVYSDEILLAKTWLSGTVLQGGLTPIGYITLAIPARRYQRIIWMNKQIEDRVLLVFPKDYTIDCISYDQFHMYTISIKKDYFQSLLELYEIKKTMIQLLDQGTALNLDVASYFKIVSYLEALFQAYNHSTLYELSKSDSLLLLSKLPGKIFHLFNHENIIEAKQKIRRRDIGVRKATEIIVNNLESSLRISDLCEETSLSERSLEYGFKDYYGLSPKTFMKRMKLVALRNDLLKSRAPISQLAFRYGFKHMGQLSSDYKTQFGELPSET